LESFSTKAPDKIARAIRNLPSFAEVVVVVVVVVVVAVGEYKGVDRISFRFVAFMLQGVNKGTLAGNVGNGNFVDMFFQ
jgi:hypothetical protein